MQIEIVSDVVLVYFHKELVAFEVTKPADPPCTRFAIIIIV
jgi:hypothetical protein